ncbi:hypothetical protein MY11210_007434 [Beauveria gryllotalpidicola]
MLETEPDRDIFQGLRWLFKNLENHMRRNDLQQQQSEKTMGRSKRPALQFKDTD